MKNSLLFLSLMVVGVVLMPGQVSGQEEEDPLALSWGSVLGSYIGEAVVELDIMKYQAHDLQKVHQQWVREVCQMYQQLHLDSALRKEAHDPKRQEELEFYKMKRNDLVKSLREKAKEIILPHQVERMDELVFWQQINSDGLAYALTSDNGLLRKPLKVDSTQVKQIESKAEALQKEFDKEVTVLREKYRSRLNESLPAEAKTKMKEMLGEESSISSPKCRF